MAGVGGPECGWGQVLTARLAIASLECVCVCVCVCVCMNRIQSLLISLTPCLCSHPSSLIEPALRCFSPFKVSFEELREGLGELKFSVTSREVCLSRVQQEDDIAIPRRPPNRFQIRFLTAVLRVNPLV